MELTVSLTGFLHGAFQLVKTTLNYITVQSVSHKNGVEGRVLSLQQVRMDDQATRVNGSIQIIGKVNPLW